jgi:type VI secretion system secreted protein Hcp
MATNMYLKFDGPDSERMEILSWSHGFAQLTSPTRVHEGSGSVESASHQSLTFTKYVDGHSGELLRQCWSGRQFQKATLTNYRPGSDNKPSLYLTVTMQHVIISNISISAGPGDVPVENLSLDYGIVTYEYVQQNGQTTAATHNLLTRSVS